MAMHVKTTLTLLGCARGASALHNNGQSGHLDNELRGKKSGAQHRCDTRRCACMCFFTRTTVDAEWQKSKIWTSSPGTVFLLEPSLIGEHPSSLLSHVHPLPCSLPQHRAARLLLGDFVPFLQRPVKSLCSFYDGRGEWCTQFFSYLLCGGDLEA